VEPKTTVINELSEAASSVGDAAQQAAQRYKLLLIPEERADDADRGPLELPYNPEEHSGAVSPNWESQDAAGVGASQQEYDFRNSAGETQSFSIVLQPMSAARNDEILTTLRIWAGEVSTRVGRPPVVRVQRGVGQAQKNFTGHIESVNYTARRTDRYGNIRVMELQLTFRRNPKAVF
jgi:hypothetical protein